MFSRQSLSCFSWISANFFSVTSRAMPSTPKTFPSPSLKQRELLETQICEPFYDWYLSLDKQAKHESCGGDVKDPFGYGKAGQCLGVA
jgi:hypothetical protein